MNAPQVKFRRIDSCEIGAFEDDLLVMNTQTLDTIVLNPTAAAIWEALKWPQSLEDITDLLAEVFADEKKEDLKAGVEKVLVALLSRKFLIKV